MPSFQIVHPKSDEQRQRLAEAVKHILLFRSLEQVRPRDILPLSTLTSYPSAHWPPTPQHTDILRSAHWHTTPQHTGTLPLSTLTSYPSAHWHPTPQHTDILPLSTLRGASLSNLLGDLLPLSIQKSYPSAHQHPTTQYSATYPSVHWHPPQYSDILPLSTQTS